ncbi:1-acyl-sn-glycerol-3-phosphate acyltransferase [Streptomyces sp. P38-E01]|uniref:1-acyl-sn-glycerol-3-phosphate acyltransferase n=1 Tax=Streptomyces tardus TaxID=2780544 RepID=A0A949JKV0_9ACTN|nr:lysophospholipid acyltransferase family protein [Streptomyces tardus]MBU7600644.1 1-acyl-sn-glycerol-3-phosphate acyltransferase [Streptomyces tardus]
MMNHHGGAAGPWLPSATCTVDHCLPAAPRTAGAARVALRAAGAAAVLCVGALCAPLCACAGRRARYALVRLWSRTLLRALGVRLRVRGHRGSGPALVVANHISWLDVVVLAAVSPGRMLAKAEVGRYPVIGALARAAGTVFIERQRLKELPAAVDRVARALWEGATVVAFPQGTTWCGQRQGPFRAAVFDAAVRTAVPVRPVALSYRQPGFAPSTVAAFVGDDALPRSLRRVIGAVELSVRAELLPPVRPSAHPSAGNHPSAGLDSSAVQGAGACGPEVGNERCGRRAARRSLAQLTTDLVVTPRGETDYAREHDRAPSG